MELTSAMALADRVKENIAKVIIGKGETTELLLAALFAGGNVLLEDVPGMGKTVLAKTLAKSLGCDYKRIQFTPDLLPGDVLGGSIFNQKTSEFEYHPGPVFTQILLADEINRATPRSQSALLECMEEKQVSADGVTRMLPRPFFVIATQNPVEIQGTFPLPEAQLDRFIMKLKMGYPTSEEGMQLLHRFIEDSPLEELEAVATAEDLIGAQDAVKKVYVSDAVMEYIVALAEKTRRGENVSLGVSPRGMLSMLHAAQAYAVVKGRDHVLPDDVKALAQHVFGHRVIARSNYGAMGAASEAVISWAVESTPVPTEKDPDAAREG